MAASNVNFAAQVGSWAKVSEDRLQRIWKASSQELASRAINATPVDTGFARASWRASSESMPQINPSATNPGGKSVAEDSGQITTVIASASFGSTLYIGATAAYMLPLEYGHSQQAPQGMVRLAAAQWPSIVWAATQEAKVRAEEG